MNLASENYKSLAILSVVQHAHGQQDLQEEHGQQGEGEGQGEGQVRAGVLPAKHKARP